MRVVLVLAVGCLLGAAALYLLSQGGDGDRADAVAAPDPRVDRLVERIAELERRVAELSSQRTAVTTPVPEQASGDGGKPPAQAPAEFSKLDTAEAFARARLLRGNKDYQAARELTQHLLTRTLDGSKRADAHLILGGLERKLGRLPEAEVAFRRAIDHAADADQRAAGGYELAMVLRDRERIADALAAAESAFAVEGANRWARIHAHWAVATLSERVGNRARAIREYDALLAYLGKDTAGFEWCVRDVTDRLAKLR